MPDRPAASETFSKDVRSRIVRLVAGELARTWDAALAVGAAEQRLAEIVDVRLGAVCAMRSAIPGKERTAEERRLTSLRVHPSASARVRKDAVMTAVAFVGRTRELEQLETCLDAAAGRKPAVVMLGGEAGIGKSRLLDEFAERARHAQAHVLRGACIELGGGIIPYAPLIDALRLLVRKLTEVRAAELAGPVWPRLAGLISDFTGSAAEGAPGGAAATQQQVFGALLRLLDHLGDSAQTVLIFEDVHWADQATLDLIAYLAHVLSDERVLLVCSHRTGLEPGHPLRLLLAEPGFIRRTSRIELPGFSDDELRAFLVDSDLTDPDLIRLGIERSDGNPFFAEQLIETGALTDPQGRRIPTTINELMLARIRKLSKDATRVVRVAATAARHVDGRLLSAVCRLDEDALDEALRECMTSGVLVTESPDDVYAFRHALLREAVYDSMLPRERTRLHTRMAEAIASDGALSLDQDLSAAVELAHHWYSADRVVEALDSALRAAVLSARACAFQTAETQYKRVLRLWPLVPAGQRPAGITLETVLVGAADAARWVRHVAQAIDLVQRAIAEVDASARPHRAGELHERLGSYLWEAGERQQSVDAHRVALGLLSTQPPSAALARVQASLATALLLEGRFAQGLREAEASIATAEAAGAVAERGRALNTAGLALTKLGEADRGLPLLREALRIAQNEDHLEDLLRAYANLGLALEDSGDLRASAQTTSRGLALARRLGLAGARRGWLLANNVSAAQYLLGDWEEAAALLKAALLEQPPVKESAFLRLTFAQIHVGRGQFAEAEAFLAQIRDQSTDPRFLEVLYACEAELALWRGEFELAHDAIARGMSALGDIQDAPARLRLCALGLRAIADLHQDEQERGDGDASLERLSAEVIQVVASGPQSGELRALARQCAAEAERAAGVDTAAVWQEVATAWDGLDRPYGAAYARWRQAAAATAARDRVGARQAAALAVETANRLGAAPLHAKVAKLAGPAHPAPAAPDHPGIRRLTARELEVLRELCTGRSDREIAKNLYIAQRTVSVHVHRILRKLEVHSRGQAAEVARSHGVYDKPDSAAADA